MICEDCLRNVSEWYYLEESEALNPGYVCLDCLREYTHHKEDE